MKAFEDATGNKLDEEKKELASEELITTGDLAEEIGQDKAAGVMNDIKADVIKNNTTDINVENPRIYFGEKTKDYAIVNTTLKETDYPEDGKENTYDYTGQAGIKLNFINKLLFAINKGDYNMMISSNINSNSKQRGTSLVIQWLKLYASNARDAGSIPGWGTKSPHAT